MHRHAHPPPSGSSILPLFLVWRKSILKTRGPATSSEREDEEINNDYISNYPFPQKCPPALASNAGVPELKKSTIFEGWRGRFFTVISNTFYLQKSQ